MKKTGVVFLIVVLMMGLTACTKVPAGYKGIKVYLLGNKKGVDIEEYGVGRYWPSFNVDWYFFPTFTQNYVWTADPAEGSLNNESITFQTKEGLSVNADVGISYHIDPTKVTTIFQKYRKGIDEITDIYLRNMVRDAFVNQGSTRSVESVYGSGKGDMLTAIQEEVTEQVMGIGIVIEKIYLIGSIRLPKPVIDALNRKIEATQRAEQRENELREAEAEAKKKVAQAQGEAEAILTRAKAQAEANVILARSITPTLIQYESIKKWDGNLPKITGNAIPMVNIGDMAK